MGADTRVVDDRSIRLGHGRIRITHDVDDHWLVSWYPDDGEAGYPGTTLSSVDGGCPNGHSMEEMAAWAVGQEWASSPADEARIETIRQDRGAVGRGLVLTQFDDGSWDAIYPICRPRDQNATKMGDRHAPPPDRHIQALWNDELIATAAGFAGTFATGPTG